MKISSIWKINLFTLKSLNHGKGQTDPFQGQMGSFLTGVNFSRGEAECCVKIGFTQSLMTRRAESLFGSC